MTTDGDDIREVSGPGQTALDPPYSYDASSGGWDSCSGSTATWTAGDKGVVADGEAPADEVPSCFFLRFLPLDSSHILL